jgi:glycosyltransferase involved in cell wall biosynthesis
MTKPTSIKEKPLATVIIPSYNHARYLPYAIESILGQTYPNIEIIIVDDGSPDSSLPIAREYASKYPERIAVHTHPNNENRGTSRTVNFAFSLASGKYLSGLPSDDALYKTKIEKQVEFLESNPQYGFVYSYADYIDSDGNRLPGKFGTNITDERDPIKTLLRTNPIPGMTMLARREAIEKAGPHDPSLVYSDWVFWLRMFLFYKGGFIPEPLVEYRVHDINTSVNIDPMLNYEYRRQVFRKLAEAAKSPDSPFHKPEYRKIIENNIARLPDHVAIAHLDNYFASVNSGRYGDGLSHLQKAIKTSRRAFLNWHRAGAIVKHALYGIRPMLAARSGRTGNK